MLCRVETSLHGAESQIGEKTASTQEFIGVFCCWCFVFDCFFGFSLQNVQACDLGKSLHVLNHTRIKM